MSVDLQVAGRLREAAVTVGLGALAVRSLATIGALHPVGPRALARVAAAPLRLGVGPATLTAVAAARHPDHPAIVDDTGALSYGDLDRRGAAISGGLARDLGVGPDRPLAIMCRNHRGFVEALVAGSRTGADVLLLNTDFPGPQLAQVLDRERPAVVVHDDEFTEAIRGAGTDAATVVASSDDLTGRPTLDGLAAAGARPVGSRAQGRLILLSSGTTGTPKGIPRDPSPAALLGPFVTLAERLPLRARQPILVAPPFFHGFGLAFLSVGLGIGATVVARRRFSAEEVLGAIVEHRVEIVVAVPTMLQRLLRAASRTGTGTGSSSLRAVISAAAPLSPTLAADLMDAFGDVVHDLYGSTETGFGALAGPADLRAAPGTVGRAPRGTTLRILDARGRPLGPGEVGRIHVGSALATEEGLQDTGDLGHVDADGRLFIDGRADDMIVSGGENVFPGEIEVVLLAHEDVEDAAVVGVPDAEFGQRSVAFVVLHADAPATVDDLTAHVRRHLARYKVPREVVLLDQLPRNPTGKVLRAELVSRASRS